MAFTTGLIDKRGNAETALPRHFSAYKFSTHLIASAEKHHILKVLEATGWRISGSKGAATISGINASTLHFRMIKQ